MTEWLNGARYFMAVLLLISLPPGLLVWYLIHPWARLWRRLGPALTYTLVLLFCLGLGWWLWTLREILLQVRSPFSWWLAIPGVLIYGVAIALEVACRKHLRLAILVGVPELSAKKGRLLTEGIYSRCRNPRYLSVACGLLGWTLILNYPVLYLWWLLSLPLLYGVVLLEERELEQRFGQEYREYCRKVPRFLPRREP